MITVIFAVYAIGVIAALLLQGISPISTAAGVSCFRRSLSDPQRGRLPRVEEPRRPPRRSAPQRDLDRDRRVDGYRVSGGAGRRRSTSATAQKAQLTASAVNVGGLALCGARRGVSRSGGRAPAHRSVSLSSARCSVLAGSASPRPRDTRGVETAPALSPAEPARAARRADPVFCRSSQYVRGVRREWSIRRARRTVPSRHPSPSVSRTAGRRWRDVRGGCGGPVPDRQLVGTSESGPAWSHWSWESGSRSSRFG